MTSPLPRVCDSTGRPVPLERELARGGEGAVYRIRGDDSRVAKHYFKPHNAKIGDKLRVMVRMTLTPALRALAAWPSEVLIDPATSQVVGFLMPFLKNCQPVQHLYAPIMRINHFPRATWAFQIRAAFNLAVAFEELHNAGHLMGDINQSNAFVSQDALVRLIDCDSFQIESGTQRFLCDVGTPHYTPPELQNSSFSSTPRTRNHDCFGLAVLLYQLVFVGRHPYAGIYSGAGDPSPEKKIADCLFSQGPLAPSWGMKPSPYTPLLADLPDRVGMLFRRAFERSTVHARPTPTEWVSALRLLESELVGCPREPGHFYWWGCPSCVWCRFEAANGPPYFFGAGDGRRTPFVADRAALERVRKRLEQISAVDFRLDEAAIRPAKPVPALAFPMELLEALDEYRLAQRARADRQAAVGIDDRRRASEDERDREVGRIREQLQSLEALRDRTLRSIGDERDRITRRNDESRRNDEFLRDQVVKQSESECQRVKRRAEDSRRLCEATRDQEILQCEAEFSVMLEELRAEFYDSPPGPHENVLRLDWVSAAMVGGIFTGLSMKLLRDRDPVFGFVGNFLALAFVLGFVVHSLWSSIARNLFRPRLTAAEQAARREHQREIREIRTKHLAAFENLEEQILRAEKAHSAVLGDRNDCFRQAEAQRKVMWAEFARQEFEAEEDYRRLREGPVRQIQLVEADHRARLTGIERESAAALLPLRTAEERARSRAELLIAQERTRLENLMRTSREERKSLEALWTQEMGAHRSEHGCRIADIRTDLDALIRLPQEHKTECERLAGRARDRALTLHLRLHGLSEADLPGIGPSRVADLAANKITCAADIQSDQIQAIYGFGPALTRILVEWKNDLCKRFHFDPTRDVDRSEYIKIDARYRDAERRSIEGIDRHSQEVARRSAECRSRLDVVFQKLCETAFEAERASVSLRQLESLLPQA